MNEKILIVLFDEEELTKTLIESYLKEVTFSYEILKFNEFDADLIPLTSQKKIIIANVNKTNVDALKKISQLSLDKNNHFIVISYDKSADLQVNALKTGAKDFLPKPLIQSDFINSVAKIYKDEIMQKDMSSTPKVFSVVSKEKGVGRTFFALNFAKELADASKANVLLIDFNNNLNDISYLLNIDIKCNTPFFINKIDASNSKEIVRYVSRYKNSSLYIIANGNIRNEETKVDESKIRFAIDEFKKYFKYIVIDNDMKLDAINEELYEKSDNIFYVASSSLAKAAENGDYITTNLSRHPVSIILNKYNSSKDEAIINKLEQAFGRQILLKIPKNIVAISTAQSKSSTIKEVGEQLDISKMYVQLAKEIIGRD